MYYGVPVLPGLQNLYVVSWTTELIGLSFFLCGACAGARRGLQAEHALVRCHLTHHLTIIPTRTITRSGKGT